MNRYATSHIAEADVHRHPSAIFFRLNAKHDLGGVDNRNTQRNGPPEDDFSFLEFTGHQDESENNSPYYCLPIFNVSMTVDVISSVSQHFLTQNFHNPSNVTIEESTYSFPLYDGAVISSFKCTIGDGRVLRGCVKPTPEAHATFKKAVRERQAAALIHEHTPEIFEVRLWNLPPKQTTKIEIVYITSLKVDPNGESLSLTIPTSIAPRYGTSPLNQHSGRPLSTEGTFSLTINIQTEVPITRLESTSHPISVEIGHELMQEAVSFTDLASSPAPTTSGPQNARAILNDSSAVLGKDFVLRIFGAKGTLLQSQALLEPADAKLGQYALMVSLNPRELLLTLDTSEMRHEIILVADRSGSMVSKVARLREALKIFVGKLPPECYLNLVSFGSSHSSLWPTSSKLSRNAMQYVLARLKDFEADMGGTEILAALKHAVSIRRGSADIATQIIVLTDGEAWNTEDVITYVRETKQDFGEAIRFFALGIGDTVSHRLIEGIGTAGGGFGEVVSITGHGTWHQKVVTMMEGALLPSSWSCSISCNEIPGGARILPIHPLQETASQSTITGESSSSRQESLVSRGIVAPFSNFGLHPYLHRTIFVLMDQLNECYPKDITVTIGTPTGTNSTTTLPIHVSRRKSSAIHTLAAKAAIADLASGDSWLHNLLRDTEVGRTDGRLTSLVREEAERLGVTYSLSSKWTTFVATEATSRKSRETSMYRAKQLDLALLVKQQRSSLRACSLIPEEEFAHDSVIHRGRNISACSKQDTGFNTYLRPFHHSRQLDIFNSGFSLNQPQDFLVRYRRRTSRDAPTNRHTGLKDRANRQLQNQHKISRGPDDHGPPLEDAEVAPQVPEEVTAWLKPFDSRHIFWLTGAFNTDRTMTLKTLIVKEFSILICDSDHPQRTAHGVLDSVVYYLFSHYAGLELLPSKEIRKDHPDGMSVLEQWAQIESLTNSQIETSDTVLVILVRGLDACAEPEIEKMVQLFSRMKVLNRIHIKYMVICERTEAWTKAFSQISNEDYQEISCEQFWKQISKNNTLHISGD